MLGTSFTLAEEFFSLVINLSHLRRVLRGSVLGPWRLGEDEHNERFRPFEPQIRRRGTAAESEMAAAAARRLIKGSRWSVKCVRGGGGGRREGEREKWGGLSLAVTWNSCFSAARWRWILAHFLPVPPLYLCCQFTVVGGPESHSFPGERRKINATAAINHSRRRIVAHKRSRSCKCLLLPSALVFFSLSLLQGRPWHERELFLREIAPSGWHCGSEVAVLTLQVWHWAESLESLSPGSRRRTWGFITDDPRPVFAAVTQIMYEEQRGREEKRRNKWIRSMLLLHYC